MKSSLRQWWRFLWEGLWFAPGLITAAALLLGALLSGLLGEGFSGGKTPSFDPSAARAVLTALAAGSITVAGVVFSLTMVVLSSSSSQFGPRLLPNFLRKTGTKLAIGGFVGSFAYQMALAAALALERQVADAAVWVGILGGLGAFAILLGFLDMVAKFIQVPYIIDEVAGNMERALQDFISTGGGLREATQPAVDSGFVVMGEVRARRAGYLVEIDTETICRRAEAGNLLVKCRVRAGAFVFKGEVMATVHGGRDSEPKMDGIDEAFAIGPSRTSQQDIEFTVRQLVEIAAKALSPGVNDPYTAINVIERLGGVMQGVIGHRLPSGLWHDEDGVLRLAIPVTDALGLFDAAYLPLRQHGRHVEAVAIALIDSLLALARQASHPDMISAIRHHADLLKEDFERGVSSSRDLADFRERYDALLEETEGGG